jgi:hypothetical protein
MAATDAEGVVRGLGCARDPSTSLRAGPGQTRLVGNVPAEGLEEGVEELGAELFFLAVAEGEAPIEVLGYCAAE